MTFFLWAILTALSTNALAVVPAEIKVCTVLHENKSSKCLSSDKQSFPTTKLLGITKMKRGFRTRNFEHRWNGARAVEVIALDQGRVLISTFSVPQGHSGVVVFSVSDTDGSEVDSKTMEVARGPLSVSAHLVTPTEVKETVQVKALPAQVAAPVVATAAIVEADVTSAPAAELPEKPVTAKKSEKVMQDDLPALDHIETDDTASALSQMAKEGGDLPDADVTLEETRKAVEGRVADRDPVQETVADKDETGLLWKRIEIHGGYVTQEKTGSSYTVIPYYAPEFRSESFWGFGGRIGGTEWKQAKGKNITAIEADVHLSVNIQTSKGRLTLQPAYGYHGWSKFGNNSSYGGVVELKMNAMPVSVLGSAQVWTYKKIDYRLVSVGLGLEF